MPDHDTQASIRPSDVSAAIGLLTRLPVKVNEASARARGAKAAWAYPLAGLAVAIGAGVSGQIALWLGLTPFIAAALALVVMVVITGALHEDGLADAADGLWGGWEKDRRLEIMKDSRTGAYGVIAIVLSLLLRAAALAALIAGGALWAGIVVPAVVGRAAMVGVMSALPHARADGLSQSVGRPNQSTALIACVIALAVTLLFSIWAVIPIVVFAGLAWFGCIAVSRAKIGGQTGDIIGATGQIVEIITLLVLVAVY